MYTINRDALALVFIFKVCVLNNKVHPHNTRQAEKCNVISYNTNVRAFSIQVYSVILWNDLSLDFSNCTILARFKREINKLINK